MLAQERLGSSWENWEASEIISSFKMWANFNVTSNHFGWGSTLLNFSKRGLVNLEWLGVGIVIVQSALSSWATLLESTSGALGWAIASTLHGSISCEVLGAILSLHLVLDDIGTFFRNELAVGPVASLELGEDEHAFVTHFKGTSSWNLLEVRGILIFVWNQVVVQVKRKILLGDLVFHDHRIGNSIDDACSNLLEKFEVLGLVMAGVPAMLFAVLTELDNKDNVVAASVGVSIIHMSKKEWFLRKSIISLE